MYFLNERKAQEGVLFVGGRLSPTHTITNTVAGNAKKRQESETHTGGTEGKMTGKCKYCGEEFEKRVNNQRYCSQRCCKKFYYKKLKAETFSRHLCKIVDYGKKCSGNGKKVKIVLNSTDEHKNDFMLEELMNIRRRNNVKKI